MRRTFVRSICRMLIGVVLFAQFAVSAYACPSLLSSAKMSMPESALAEAGKVSVAAAEPESDRLAVDCAGMSASMDPDLANLCAEHCHQGQQSGQAATLTVPAALLTALYVTPLAPEPFVAPGPAADATSALAAASPPIAILHCCFRI